MSPEKLTEELNDQEILALVDNYERKLFMALKPLETPTGPKLTFEHIALVSLMRDVMFNSKSEATEAKKQLDLLVTRVRKVRGKGEGISKLLAETEMCLIQSVERVRKERDAVWGLGAGVGRDELAHRVAVKVSEIYEELQGKPAGYGNDQFNEPSSPFTKALVRVYDVMKIIRGHQGPGSSAVNSQKDV